jgi:basic amino acid/polyamine antiporter, APA family
MENKIERRIGPTTATAIVVANMIGAGIFTTSGIVASMLPNARILLLCWFLGGLIAIAGALSYTELATRMPEEGGEYVYLKKLFHPSLAFLTGWASFFVGFSAPIAASALGFSEYLFAGLHIQNDVSTGFFLFSKKIIAIFIIALFTGIHYFGIKFGAAVQNALTVIKVFIVIGLALAGTFVAGGNVTFLQNVGGPINAFQFGTAMMIIMFAYCGWNAAAYIAGELKNPRRTLPISLLSGTVIVMVLYLAVNVFILKAIPYSEMQGVIAIVETASVAAFGPWMGSVLSLFVAIMLLSSLSAFIMIGPRVYYAMARDGLFFKFASNVHSKTKVPGRSILIQGCIAVLMVSVGSFERLVMYIIFSLSIFPILAVSGLFIARRKKIGEDMAVKTWGYPFVPAFYLLSSFILMIISYINRPVEASVAIVTVALGIPIYFILKSTN